MGTAHVQTSPRMQTDASAGIIRSLNCAVLKALRYAHALNILNGRKSLHSVIRQALSQNNSSIGEKP